MDYFTLNVTVSCGKINEEIQESVYYRTYFIVTAKQLKFLLLHFHYFLFTPLFHCISCLQSCIPFISNYLILTCLLFFALFSDLRKNPKDS